MEAGNRLLLPWRHGVSPAPVDFHHYILSASMAQQRGLEPPSRMNSPDHPLSRRADYQLSDCCRLPGRTISTLFHRRRPHRKPEYPGTRYGCSLAAGVGFEPTGHVSGRRFSGPIGYHYLTLPCGEEGGTRTLKPHLQGSDRLAICCLTIGLTPSFRLQIV